jgi:branched-chain amino acid aminotransferase
MRAQNGRIFRLESHVQRLCRSAEALLSPIDRALLPSPAVFAELLRRNGLQRARVRLTVSAGPVRVVEHDSPPTFSLGITAADLGSYPNEYYEKGVPSAISEFRVSPTDPTAGHKTTGYLPRLVALREAQRARCVEALWFTTTNHLAEGCISNVFLVHQGVLKTPPVNTPVLPGIARGLVLSIAREIGVEVLEGPLTIEDVLTADEVLLTNTIMQVIPVIRVERHDVSDGRVGPMAKKLLEEFRQRVRQECSGE